MLHFTNEDYNQKVRVGLKMYVTKTLSSLLRNPNTLSEPPPAGPWSGVAVILDKEFIKQNAGRLDSSSRIGINYLPFPQNRLIEIVDDSGESFTYENVMMIPVVDQPLSSHIYYVIQAAGKYSGLVISCPNEEEMHFECCGPPTIHGDAKPKPFDPNNIFQQVRIHKSDKEPPRFRAESLVYDGLVPGFMSKQRWRTTTAITTKWTGTCNLNEIDGQGMCESLRNRLPEFGSDNVAVVGTWYVPFIFVKEFGMYYKELMRSSMYYKMSLEQRWERVFEAENVSGDLVAVVVDVEVKSENVMLGGNVAVRGGGRLANGVVRFESDHPGVRGIGLSVGVMERMKWEQTRAGWTDVGGRDNKLERVEEHVGRHGWRRFGCYVLVERFVLRKMDGSLALTYDFYHIHHMRTKWE